MVTVKVCATECCNRTNLLKSVIKASDAPIEEGHTFSINQKVIKMTIYTQKSDRKNQKNIFYVF